MLMSCFILCSVKFCPKVLHLGKDAVETACALAADDVRSNFTPLHREMGGESQLAMAVDDL